MVINEERIRASTAATVPELLRQYPGIQVRDNSGSPNQQVDLRGFGITGDQNTLVLLDGQRISENELTTVTGRDPLAAIERIEISAAAARLCGEARPAAINIITKAPQRNRKARLPAAASAVTRPAIFAGVSISPEKTSDWSSTRANSKPTIATPTGCASRMRRLICVIPGRGTLYAKFGGDDQQLLLPNALTEAQIAVNRRQAAPPFGSYANMSGGYVNLGGEFELGDAEFALNGGYRGRQTNAALFLAVATKVTVKSLTPRVKLPFALAGTRHTLVAGVDWEEWDSDATATPGLKRPLSTQRNRAAYFRDSIALSSATVLSAGARLHRTTFGTHDIAGGSAASSERDLRAFEISARHRFGERVAVYGKFGNSFRVPNVNDNYNLFTGTVAQLEPQTSHDREIGTDLTLGRASYRLAVYEMDVNNEIHFNPVTFSNVNLAPTRRYGFEGEGKWQFTAGLSAFANYTYAVSRFRRARSPATVPLVPRHAANLRDLVIHAAHAAQCGGELCRRAGVRW